MAYDVHQCQPQKIHVSILPQSRTPWTIPPGLQGRTKRQTDGLACEDHSFWVRIDEATISYDAGLVQWIQVDLPEHASIGRHQQGRKEMIDTQPCWVV
jgi:hypothetical protein